MENILLQDIVYERTRVDSLLTTPPETAPTHLCPASPASEYTLLYSGLVNLCSCFINWSSVFSLDDVSLLYWCVRHHAYYPHLDISNHTELKLNNHQAGSFPLAGLFTILKIRLSRTCFQATSPFVRNSRHGILSSMGTTHVSKGCCSRKEGRALCIMSKNSARERNVVVKLISTPIIYHKTLSEIFSILDYPRIRIRAYVLQAKKSNRRTCLANGSEPFLD